MSRSSLDLEACDPRPRAVPSLAFYSGDCFLETERQNDHGQTLRSLGGIGESLSNARHLIESVRRSFPLLPLQDVPEDAFEEIDGGLDSSLIILNEALMCVDHLLERAETNGASFFQNQSQDPDTCQGERESTSVKR